MTPEQSAARPGLRLELFVRVLAFGVTALLACWLTRPWAADLRESRSVERQPDPLETPGPAAVPASAPPLRVLFVGNSLSGYNGMPSILAKLAAAAGEPRALEPNVLTPGGYHLRDHVRDDEVELRLSRTRFDYVVLQDQGQVSGWPKDRREFLLDPGRALNALIREAGARPLLYATFARREGDFAHFRGDTYEAMQARVNDGYAELGRDIDAPVVPVGRVWQETLRTHPSLRLWASDGQHPSLAGSYLVACTFLVQLYGHSPVGNPYRAGLQAQEAREIQESVAKETAAPR